MTVQSKLKAHWNDAWVGFVIGKCGTVQLPVLLADTGNAF